MNTVFLMFMLVMSPQETWEQANRDYTDGKYEAALTGYLELYHQGIENGALFFNMGNTCFKLRKMGYAVLYFEKAQAYLPGNEDLSHNLNLALAARPRAKTDPNADQMEAKIRTLMHTVPYLWVYILTAVLLGLSGLAWFVLFYKHPGAKTRVAVFSLGLLSLLLMGGVSYQYHYLQKKDRGVVLKSEEPIRSGPSSREDVSFTVYEGKRVKILARSNGWLRIRLENGYNGWIREDAIGTI
ncbi:MAG: hypothetical protein CSA81_04470 [Acidobacteria bacterium]|nr:MAG: hypothetical protein CSA81_04470 [Acidobacteriota bacterium]PIE89745.1 MAG: hypothetical protein CR997_09315 [Acidobacteriota bacterium]